MPEYSINRYAAFTQEYTQGIGIELEKITKTMKKEREKALREAAEAQRKEEEEREKNKKVFRVKRVAGGYIVTVDRGKKRIQISGVIDKRTAHQIREKLEIRQNHQSMYGQLLSIDNSSWGEYRLAAEQRYGVTIEL